MTHLDSNGNWNGRHRPFSDQHRQQTSAGLVTGCQRRQHLVIDLVHRRRDLLQAVGGFYRSTPPVGGGLRITRRDIAHDPPPEVPPQVATPSSLPTPDV
jgi:hypothetical protein